MTSAAFERCALCGGVLGAFRIMVGGEAFHRRCSHDARDQRVEDLEVALRAALSFLQERHADHSDGHAQMVITAVRGALRKPRD